MLSKEYIEDERKALEKSGGKDNNDKQFPHAACIIDVTRCSVAFANVEDLISYPLVTPWSQCNCFTSKW